MPITLHMTSTRLEHSILFIDYTTAREVTVELPFEARTESTVLRWRQLDNSGNAYDEWGIDRIIVSTNDSQEIFQDDFSIYPPIP